MSTLLLLYAPTVGMLLAAGDNRRSVACSLSSVSICDLEDRYAAWPENRTHNPPHSRRTPDTDGVAALDHHPGGTCQTGSDHALAGRWHARGPDCRHCWGHPSRRLHVGEAVSAGRDSWAGRQTRPWAPARADDARQRRAGQPEKKGADPHQAFLSPPRFEDRYAAWPEDLTHDPPHGGRTRNAHPG